MAVLVEAISVIDRADTIAAKLPTTSVAICCSKDYIVALVKFQGIQETSMAITVADLDRDRPKASINASPGLLILPNRLKN